MKHLAPILRRSDEQERAAFTSYSRHRKAVCVGVLSGCETALDLRFRVHHPEGFEGDCAHRRHARVRLLFSGRTTFRYRRFQRFEPPFHRLPLEPVFVTMSGQRDATSQPCIDMNLPIRAQGFALESEHFSERFLHRLSPISHRIRDEIGSKLRSRTTVQISFAYRRTMRRHSKYVQREQGKIKGAARRALKALSAHGFSHLIPEIHDALLEIAR
jgi:hypothetical protein